MIVDIDVRLAYQIKQPIDLILQVRAPSFADQKVLSDTFDVGAPDELAETAAEAGLGSRTLLRTSQDFTCSYVAKVEIDRPALDISVSVVWPPPFTDAFDLRLRACCRTEGEFLHGDYERVSHAVGCGGLTNREPALA